jgi:3-oxoacyl-[acyl-carrier protein] reductase
MTPELRGKVALVTGAGRGIGRAISLALAKCGAQVHLAARTVADLSAAADEVRAAGGAATVAPVDLNDESQIRRLFENLPRLDVLINNAAVGRFGPVSEFSAADLDAILAVNVRGTFLCCREAMRLMMPAKGGYIINISSVLGFRGYPDQAAYAASKHAIMGLTKSLATEAQPHLIRVSAILPGGVDTEMSSASRPDLNRAELIKPGQIADAVLYLLSLSDTTAAVDEIYIRRSTAKPF